MRAATYELEFREVLALYLHNRRRERGAAADRLDAQAGALEIALITSYGLTSERVRGIQESVQGLRDRAQALREPADMELDDLTEGQQAFLAGAHRRGD